MLAYLDRLFNRNRFFRRALLAWACWLITVVVLRVTEVEALDKINGAVATVVTAIIGILTTVIAFYQWSRRHEGRDSDVGPA